MAQASKEAATTAFNQYKSMRQRWPDIKKKRDEYRDLRKELLFMENFAGEYRDTHQKIEKAKEAVFKDLGDKKGVYEYFRNKHNRLNVNGVKS